MSTTSASPTTTRSRAGALAAGGGGSVVLRRPEAVVPFVAGKAVVSLTTGLEDTERVTVAFPVAVGAAEQGRPNVVAGTLGGRNNRGHLHLV